MRVLILGSGGREHALGFCLREAWPDAQMVFCPGNGGTKRLGENEPASLTSPAAVRALARNVRPDWILIGPEAPLVAGVSDALRGDGYSVFGPSQRAALIEGSKVYAKRLMREHGIPTAAFEVYDDREEAEKQVQKGLFPKVVKADGLAAGKGVVIVRTPEQGVQAVAALMQGGESGSVPGGEAALGGERPFAAPQILIEAFLEGEEVSAFALARGEDFVLLPLFQDHKRIGEGDTGPNTGGMGAYGPFVGTNAGLLADIADHVIAPTLRALAEDGRPFEGLLYAGLMLVNGRPSVLEFNCRFGDPETQALVPLAGPALARTVHRIALGERNWTLAENAAETLASGRMLPAATPNIACATVVLASQGYPGPYKTGFPIRGLERAQALPETWVFHAGTVEGPSGPVTSGGRVLAVTGRGADLRGALGRAYEAVSLLDFEGMAYRKDIGARGLSR